MNGIGRILVGVALTCLAIFSQVNCMAVNFRRSRRYYYPPSTPPSEIKQTKWIRTPREPTRISFTLVLAEIPICTDWTIWGGSPVGEDGPESAGQTP